MCRKTQIALFYTLMVIIDVKVTSVEINDNKAFTSLTEIIMETTENTSIRINGKDFERTLNNATSKGMMDDFADRTATKTTESLMTVNNTQDTSPGSTQVINSKTENSTNENRAANVRILTGFKEDPVKIIFEEVEYIQNFYILPPVCTVGIVGNSLVAFVLFAKRGTSSSFIYMFALIVVDTLSLVSDLFVPFSAILELFESEAWHRAAVAMLHYNKTFISYVFRCTAINILCVLSTERFIAIKYPLHVKSSLTVKYPRIFLLISFLVGIFSNITKPINVKLSYVQIAGSNATIYRSGYSDVYKSHKEEIDTVVIVMKFFSGPIQIFFFCVMNALIVHGIYRSRQAMSAMKMSNTTRQRDTKNLQIRLCKMFLVLCLTNVLAFLPTAITAIIGRLFPELKWNIQSYAARLVIEGGNILRILNSASDFMVMLIMSLEIRLAIMRKFVCLRSLDASRSTKDVKKTP